MKRVVMYIKDRDNTIEELLKYIKWSCVKI